MSRHGVTCGECSAYEGRVYSISGNDRRFPRLPMCIQLHGCVHEGCRHDFYPYVAECAGYSELSNVIAFSNRPFFDSRTPEQRFIYEEECRKEQNSAEGRRQYDILLKKAPDLAPKSLSGFCRMRNANSKNYQALLAECKKRKIRI